MNINQIIRSIKTLQEYVHNINVANGWWEKPRNDGEMIALMHSELSEALEYTRGDDDISDHIPPHSGVAEEMADAVIRILDFCEGRNLNLAETLFVKLDFNKTRGYKHGGKKI